MDATNHQHNLHSEDQLNEQINDKLSELWNGMRDKKKQLMRNLTPAYSRRSERTLSDLNATHTQTNITNHHSVTENQLMKIKEKLVSESSGRKIKQTQVQRLKNTIAQLTNDKKLLIKQIKNLSNHSISVNHLQEESQENVDGRTANFHAKENRKKNSEVFWNKRERLCMTDCANKQNYNQAQNKTAVKPDSCTLTLQDLSKNRLIQLLKSTSQYRQFAFYYDSHQLSYLKRLQQQHRRNCSTNYSAVEKQFWAPTDLCLYMKTQNARYKWGLSEVQLEEMISQMKGWFQAEQQDRLKNLKEDYQRKIDKLKREKDNKMPYDLIRLTNARERHLCHKKRLKSSSGK